MKFKIKKLIFIYLFTIFPLVSAYSSGPHKVFGNLQYENGQAPGSITFTAYITTRSGDILNQDDYDCGYENGIWFVQCGNFNSNWNLWDILHVEFDDGNGKAGSIEVTLTSDAADNAGITTLTAENHNVKLAVADISGQRGSNILIPLGLSGITLADSVIAYEVTVQFDSDVLVGIGAAVTGTMTQNWGSPFVGPLTTEMTIGGFTSNKQGSRLVFGDGNLVKAEFLIHGIPSSQTSNASLVRIKSAVIYTLTETLVLSRTKTGALRVTSDGTHVPRNITLHPYWNLVSLGISPDPNTIPEVIEGLDVSFIYGFRAGEGPMSWDINRPAFLNDLQILDGLHGYWVKSTSFTVQTWAVEGVLINTTTPLTLYNGWNLIGYLPTSGDIIAHGFQSLDTSYTRIIGWDASSSNPEDWDRAKPPFLNTLTHFLPTAGYWVKMEKAGTLIYPTGGYSPPKAYGFQSESAGGGNLGGVSPYWCDFWAVQPGFLQLNDTIRAYDPDNVLCGDTLVNVQGGFLLHVFGDDPGTLDIDEGAVLGDTLRFTLNGKAVEVAQGDYTWEPDTSKQVVLFDPSTDVRTDKNSFLPRAVLHQNYPNPFNGETYINFSLPVQEAVELKIIDSLGRTVDVLIHGKQFSAGDYKVKWSGTDHHGSKLPSSIYFYQLKVGQKSVLTGKMLLLN